MEKLMIIVFVLLFCDNIYSLDHGLITGFDVGYSFIDKIAVNRNRGNFLAQNHNDTLFIDMTMGYYVDNFKLIGTYTNTLKFLEIDNFSPVQDRYKIDLSYTFLNYFTVGFTHWCDHPVVTSQDTRNVTTELRKRSLYVSFYKEF